MNNITDMPIEQAVLLETVRSLITLSRELTPERSASDHHRRVIAALGALAGHGALMEAGSAVDQIFKQEGLI